MPLLRVKTKQVPIVLGKPQITNYRHLKSIAAAKPACVAVHQKTGDIYVFSWYLLNRAFPSAQIRVEPVMTHLGPLENPVVKARCPLPLRGYQ